MKASLWAVMFSVDSCQSRRVSRPAYLGCAFWEREPAVDGE